VNWPEDLGESRERAIIGTVYTFLAVALVIALVALS